MTGKHVLNASMAVLVIGAIVVIAYQSGRNRNEDTRASVREVIDARLAPLDGIEERLAWLETEVASLRDATSPNAPDKAGGLTPDAETRLSAVQSQLSTLQTRIKGLEDDPVRRGYAFLESENAELRREGVNILQRVARFDPDARAAIRGLLHDPSSRVREQAAQILRNLRDKDSATEMKTLLADSDPATRRRAIQALGAMEVRDAAREIGQNLLMDADDRVREAAADALGILKSQEGVEFLTEALKDRNEAVKGEAIASLGEIGATSAAPQLRSIYDQDPGIHRLRLALALKSLGDGVPLQKEIGRLSEVAKSGADERIRRQAERDLAVLTKSASQ